VQPFNLVLSSATDEVQDFVSMTFLIPYIKDISQKTDDDRLQIVAEFDILSTNTQNKNHANYCDTVFYRVAEELNFSELTKDEDVVNCCIVDSMFTKQKLTSLEPGQQFHFIAKALLYIFGGNQDCEAIVQLVVKPFVVERIWAVVGEEKVFVSN